MSRGRVMRRLSEVAFAPKGCLALGSTRVGEYHSFMTVVQSPPAREARFTDLYIRLVSGLGIVSVGGWVALLLYGRGDGVVAQIVLIGSAMLGGQRAGALVSGFVMLEVAVLFLFAVQMPLLGYVWADLGPLTLVAVAAIQVPFAVAATAISRRRSPRA